MNTYFHPVIGLIAIADHVQAVAWANDGNGNKTFVDATASHPNVVPVCLYDTVNYGILCRKVHAGDAIDIDAGIQYGHIVAKHINLHLARQRASKELGL